jgi:hypothetical protein
VEGFSKSNMAAGGLFTRVLAASGWHVSIVEIFRPEAADYIRFHTSLSKFWLTELYISKYNFAAHEN